MLKRITNVAVAVLLLGVAPPATGDDQSPRSESQPPRSRRFEFSYKVEVTGLAAGEVARLWMPVPPSTDEQSARLVSQRLPGASQLGYESKYGNGVLFVEAAAAGDGAVAAEVVYDVTRREVRGQGAAGRKARRDSSLALYLQPDARVPTDGKPLTLLQGVRLPGDQLQLGRTLYDLVNGHMRYSKEGTGWGQGDAVWACDSKYGNCSDFHSLFISLARSQGVPAKFEIGFSLPPERSGGELAGYHCWAQFRPAGRGWVPVDISEANKEPTLVDYYFGSLTEDRVALSVGRDLVLVPPQAGPPLNFFVYPYVEVGGKPYPAENVQGRYSFKDVNAAD